MAQSSCRFNGGSPLSHECTAAHQVNVWIESKGQDYGDTAEVADVDESYGWKYGPDECLDRTGKVKNSKVNKGEYVWRNGKRKDQCP